MILGGTMFSIHFDAGIHESSYHRFDNVSEDFATDSHETQKGQNIKDNWRTVSQMTSFDYNSQKQLRQERTKTPTKAEKRKTAVENKAIAGLLKATAGNMSLCTGLQSWRRGWLGGSSSLQRCTTFARFQHHSPFPDTLWLLWWNRAFRLSRRR